MLFLRAAEPVLKGEIIQRAEERWIDFICIHLNWNDNQFACDDAVFLWPLSCLAAAQASSTGRWYEGICNFAWRTVGFVFFFCAGPIVSRGRISRALTHRPALGEKLSFSFFFLRCRAPRYGKTPRLNSAGSERSKKGPHKPASVLG